MSRKARSACHPTRPRFVGVECQPCYARRRYHAVKTGTWKPQAGGRPSRARPGRPFQIQRLKPRGLEAFNPRVSLPKSPRNVAPDRLMRGAEINLVWLPALTGEVRAIQDGLVTLRFVAPASGTVVLPASQVREALQMGAASA